MQMDVKTLAADPPPVVGGEGPAGWRAPNGPAVAGHHDRWQRPQVLPELRAWLPCPCLIPMRMQHMNFRSKHQASHIALYRRPQTTTAGCACKPSWSFGGLPYTFCDRVVGDSPLLW